MSQYSSGGYLQNSSPYGASPGSSKRSEAAHSLRPITIAQILKATQAHTDADWMLENTEVGQITVVAQVVKIQVQATNVVFRLEDGTGQINARYWTDASGGEDDTENRWGEIEENTYVRVTGTIKTFNNKRYFNAIHIRPSRDPMEVYFHHLETITITLMFEKGAPSGDAAQPNGQGNSAYSAGSHSTGGVSDQYSHLPALQRAILQYMRDNKPPEDSDGIFVGDIATTVGGGDASKISEALDKLMDEGHVFTTINDSHFNISD